jgi:hypothetical protein
MCVGGFVCVCICACVCVCVGVCVCMCVYVYMCVSVFVLEDCRIYHICICIERTKVYLPCYVMFAFPKH